MPFQRTALWTLGFALLTFSPAGAQDPAPVPSDQALLVFLDCNTHGCDFDHFRREITFVSWVRDRQDAQVHVIATGQTTGGGGRELTLAFIGLREFRGKADTLRYVSAATDTEAEVRDGLTQTLRLGLVRYAAATGAARRLRVTYAAPTQATAAQPERDPWNFWVFRVSANGSVNGEATQSGYSIRGSVSANRTTEAHKITFSVSGNYRRSEFELDSVTTIVDVSENYSSSMLTVWSLSPRWSIGARANGNRSTFLNRDLSVSGGPAIEFNVYPYDESTRRSITLLYAIEAAGFDYEKVTVEGETSEVLPRHSLNIGTRITQPWGSIFGSVSATQYLHDPTVHRIDTFTGFEIRVFRGLTFNVFGSFSRTKDQFFLAAEGLTPEEILLRRRQRETDFRFNLSVGLSYRFGSKFNNVVNPRMDEGGEFFFFF
jgi:hypothetical protein